MGGEARPEAGLPSELMAAPGGLELLFRVTRYASLDL